MTFERESITLLNGFVIERQSDGFWPALQDVQPDVDHACDICPLRIFCDDNNEFDCQCYNMFSGFYFTWEEGIRFLAAYDIQPKDAE